MNTNREQTNLMFPFRYPRLWLTLGWLLIALVVLLSLWYRLPRLPAAKYADKLGHLIAYMTLMLWFANIYQQKRRRLWLITGFIAMGLCLELIQGLTAYRTFQYADILANSTGVLFGWLLAKTPFAVCLLQLDTWLLHVGRKVR